MNLQDHPESDKQTSGYPLPDWDDHVCFDQISLLTPREFAVLSWISAGKTNVEIAAILVTSRKTIEREVTSVLSALKIENRHVATSLFHSWRLSTQEMKRTTDD